MESGKNKHWENLFGSAWDKLVQSVPDIGAFMLGHEKKELYMDINARKILDYDNEPTYEQLSLLVSNSDERGLGKNPFRIIIAEQNEKYTACFLSNKSISSDMYSALSICGIAKLTAAAADSDKPSLLAIIHIERLDSPEISESNVIEAIAAVINSLPQNALVAASEKNRFWIYVPDFDGDKQNFLEELQESVRDVCGDVITFSAGCGMDDAPASQRMRTAEVTLFDALRKGKGTVELYSLEHYERRKEEFEKLKKFTMLIDSNLFTYHFQPIVSAQDGAVVAYEALMRTDKSINMFPLEIIETATKSGRLYDIEKATMRNTLHYISMNQSVFKDKKLFVNSIPAHMLTHSDWNSLVQDYGELMEKLVIEMTEQTEIDNDKLTVIHERFSKSGIDLAIDDYGTGYSNTTNLLRYKPKCVKIDRSLIENIDGNLKMQKLVASLIDFCHENGFSVLAEGVETRSELKTMIKLGSDLIQGFYISRPKPFAIAEISADLRDEIILFYKLYANETIRIYRTKENGTIDMEQLENARYDAVFIESERIQIEGIKDKKYHIYLIIKDGIKTSITLKNVCLTTFTENTEQEVSPCIGLGKNTEAEIILEGANGCSYSGIFVPESASLRILGEGSMYIETAVSVGYGIGSDSEHSYGNISIESSGTVEIHTQGDNNVSIGGGRNDSGSLIKLEKCDVLIDTIGVNCIGIGVQNGLSKVRISGSRCRISLSGQNPVGIGAMQGSVDIAMQNYSVDYVVSGVNACGIGMLNGGKGTVSMSDGFYGCDLHANIADCIGTRGGDIDCSIVRSKLLFCCEGNDVTGIGDISGSGDVSIRESELDLTFRIGKGEAVCSASGCVTVEDCLKNIKVNE